MKKSKISLTIFLITVLFFLSGCSNQKADVTVENRIIETTQTETIIESNMQEENSTELTAAQEERETNNNNIGDYKQAYIDFLQSGAVLSDGSNQGMQIEDVDAATYGIVDVNLDGVPELFLFPGSTEWRYDLYTYYNGEVKLLDSCSATNNIFLYDLEGTPCYLALQESSYGNMIDVRTIENGKSKILLSYDSDYPSYEMGWQNSYTENFYIGNNPVDKATFEENAKKIFTDEGYEALMNFEVEAIDPVGIPIKNLSVIENY